MTDSDENAGRADGSGNGSENDLEPRVSRLLHRMGIPAHIAGYRYLRSAILLSVDGGPETLSATGYLYPAVAEMYGSTPSRVERAIRTAILLAWDRGDMNLLNEYFGYTVRTDRGRPTNKEFIALIADNLRMENR